MPEGAPPPHGRILGLDLGQARIGVAVSDPEARVALPLGTIRTGAPADVKAIAALVREHDVAAIVVGHPVGLSGESGEAARRAETFAAMLADALQLPVHLQDERLSTVEAERSLRQVGVKGRDRRAVVDQAAATVILRAYLDRRT